MDKKMNNEELQSRREFFKKAAKATLPMIAAVALANVPCVSEASETQMGCKAYCHGACVGDCQGACKYGCLSGCKTSCTRTCGYTCSGGNYGH